MTPELQHLHAAIAGLEAQRELLGDTIADAALATLRARLASLCGSARPEQTLKQVSILFLDVVGSTTLSQHLDPEDIHALMDGALARGTLTVQAHRGRVLQYAGDNLLAAFGADETREDDPERAVRCGLALLELGRALGDEVQSAYGRTGLNVRVGIHTGGVLLGGGIDAEGSIRGIAVNIAARMEQAAPAGGLRITHATYAHVRGVFDVQLQDPITVKGIDEPIVTYLVHRAKERAFRIATRGIEGVETRMVGRDAELDALQYAFKRLFTERRLAAIIVVADAGLGKSRLLYEFENWAETRPEAFYIFQGRATPQTQGQPYGLLRDILAWRLQIGDGDSLQTAKEKVEQGIAPLFVADDGEELAQAHAHLLGHLIGLDFSESRHLKGILDDGKQIRNRGFHAAAQMFRRVAAQTDTPIVLQLEDLHWADDASLDFLNYLAQVDRDVPMLVLGLTRPTLFERRADWRSTDPVLRRVELEPLGRAHSRELAKELLKKLPDTPAMLRELITSGAEGNPFYMEELVKMLVDEGAIDASQDRWRVESDKLLATHVPPTLTGVLQARLDGLKPTEKLALQQASVIGFVFWDQALAAIDAAALEALPGLTRRELVVPHPDTGLDGMREYVFKHQILHHVTYDTVLKRIRSDCHAKVAVWLAGQCGVRAKDFLGATAQHYEQAGDNPQACEYFTRAAEHARDRYAHEAAMSYVAQALALIGEGGGRADAEPSGHTHRLQLRWRLLDVRERTLDLQGKRTEQHADIAALQCLADALDDDVRRSEVAWRRSDVAMRTGELRSMESAARQARALAERAGDGARKLRAQQHLASALTLLGDAPAGKALAEQGLADSRSLGLPLIESLFLNTLAFIANVQDDPVLTLELCEQNLPIDRELGDSRGEAISLLNLGIAWLDLGELAQARRYLEESLRLTRAVGDRLLESNVLNPLSHLSLRLGDDTLALAHAQSALDIAIAAEDPRTRAFALFRLGNAELALGRHEAAAAAFEGAKAVALSIDNPHPFDAEAGLARVALAQGDLAAGMMTVERLLAHLTVGDALEGTSEPRLVWLSCYQVLARAGDPRAAETLASVHGALRAKADMITNPALRHSFLNNISEHRDILAAWAAQEGFPGKAEASRAERSSDLRLF